jgi:hypothetical protein
MVKAIFVYTVILAATLAPALAGDEPFAAELSEITARGRMLADYDVAAWHATDAVIALNPPKGSFSSYVAEKIGSGWVVKFGRLDDSSSRFLIPYEATQGASSVEFSAKKDDPPVEDSAFYFFGAKAIETALGDFKGEKRSYNTSVLPADSGRLFVYIEPAQTKTGVYPLGGDVRYLISADGSAIVEKHQMHKAIIEMRPQEGSRNTVAGFHSHVLSDLPEDSDVFYVLTRRPNIPEYIGTSKHTYKIEVDGTITVVK